MKIAEEKQYVIYSKKLSKMNNLYNMLIVKKHKT